MDKKILVVFGSPRKNGYSSFMANEVVKKLESLSFKIDTLFVNKMDIKPCIACDYCRRNEGKFCIQKDDMKSVLPKIAGYEAILFSCPVYWFSINAQSKAFIDRLYSLHTEKSGILKNKKIGIMLSYGDDDPISSGVMNAINMFKDSFRYTGSKICGIIHRKERERKLDPQLSRQVDEMVDEIVKP